MHGTCPFSHRGLLRVGYIRCMPEIFTWPTSILPGTFLGGQHFKAAIPQIQPVYVARPTEEN
jgi:hypothetical protein